MMMMTTRTTTRRERDRRAGWWPAICVGCVGRGGRANPIAAESICLRRQAPPGALTNLRFPAPRLHAPDLNSKKSNKINCFSEIFNPKLAKRIDRERARTVGIAALAGAKSSGSGRQDRRGGTVRRRRRQGQAGRPPPRDDGPRCQHLRCLWWPLDAALRNAKKDLSRWNIGIFSIGCTCGQAPSQGHVPARAAACGAAESAAARGLSSDLLQHRFA